jgi:hypothetical protein
VGRIGGEEWKKMQAEVDEAMEDSSEEEGGDIDSWAMLDDVLGGDVSDEEMEGKIEGIYECRC